MRGRHIVMGAAILGLATGARADEIEGTFRLGNIRFTPTEALAYEVFGKEPESRPPWSS